MVQTVPIHVGRVPVHHSGQLVLAACHHDIQECRSPLLFLLNCVNVGGLLVEVYMEGLQVLLSIRPDDEGVICIALQRKDKSANFSTSRTRDQQPNYNRLIAKKNWSSTSAKDHCLHRKRTSFPWVYPLRSSPDKSPTKKSSLPQRPLLTGWITEQRMPSSWQYVEPYNKPKPTPQPDLPATTSNSRPQERREYCTCSRRQRQSYSNYGQRRVYTEDEADSG